MRRQISWRSGFSWKVMGAENVVKGFLKYQSLQVLKVLPFALLNKKEIQNRQIKEKLPTILFFII